MTSRDEALESTRRTIQPPCPRCGKRMTLTRVDPHSPACEIRSFDCLRCGYSVGEIVKIMPSPEP
jgi:C4-type Zn-finger protein